MKFVLCILLFALTLSAAGQEPYSVWLTEQQGLPSNTVYQVFHDAKGFTWLATEEGLCRYDGNSFKKYYNNTQTSVPGSDIKQDKFGRIWYQNFDGYCYYVENDSLKSLNQNQPLNYNPIGISTKYLFVLQTKGIDVFDIESLKLVKTIKLVRDFPALQHSLYANGMFYFIEDYDLFAIGDDLNLKHVTSLTHLSDKKQLFIATINNNVAVYIKYSQANQIKYLQVNNKVLTLATPTTIGINGTTNIKGKYAVYGNNGIMLYEKNKPVAHWFKNEAVTAVSKDFQGNYWISTLFKGVIFLQDVSNNYTPISHEPTKIISGKKGHYIFNTQGQIFYYNKDFSLQQKIAQLKNTAIYYAYLDEEKGKIFTSSLGMSVIELNNSQATLNHEYALKEVCKINNNLYAFAESAQCLLYKDKRNTNTDAWDSLFQSLPSGIHDGYKVLDIGFRAKTVAYHKPSASLYFGTNIGLFKQTPYSKSETKIGNEKFFAKKLITTKHKIYALNTKGEFYELNESGGFIMLNKLASINFKSITGAKLFNDTLLCLFGDNKIVLVNANKPETSISEPVYIIKTSELNDVSFDKQTLYLLTKKGVISVPVKYQKTTAALPRFLVDDININGNNATLNNQTLSYDKNNITINYVLLDYNGTAQNKIHYSLNNNGWTELPVTSRMLQFAALDAGKYELQFMVNDKVLESSALTFTILKPWWKRWWFVTLVLGSATFIAVSFYRWQVSILQKRNVLLKQNYDLEKELNRSVLKSIKSQMNPHFFYNALNTIQGYIFTNDKTSAANYLNKFSKLTRSILEMSDKDLVNLDEEIKSLDLYLSLEKMRFDGELEYTIIQDEKLINESVKLPPMLIQPHVENAIKHGLLHKVGNKTISISFELSDTNQLKIIIDDNGIGRKRSQELNAIKNQSHESFSTEANQTRIELMNKLRNTGASLHITDKMDSQNRPAGTLVTIILPYQNY
jgi:hypothetical protein